MNGVSDEWIGAREDEIAILITATEHLDRLRQMAAILRRRDMITDAYYQDIRDSVDYISNAVLIGKRNTANLRKGHTTQ